VIPVDDPDDDRLVDYRHLTDWTRVDDVPAVVAQLRDRGCTTVALTPSPGALAVAAAFLGARRHWK